MTPETLAERQAKVATMLHPNATAAADPAAPRTRKPRSDRGTIRAPKPKPAAAEPVPAGAITVEQADQLQSLISLTFHRREEFAAADVALRDAQYTLDSFVRKLTASK
jgi:hypothetical protein